MFKKIDDITDDDKKSIENIWGGLIEQNQKIFTLKKYSEDTEACERSAQHYDSSLRGAGQKYLECAGGERARGIHPPEGNQAYERLT